jgi:hypothetical protein
MIESAHEIVAHDPDIPHLARPMDTINLGQSRAEASYGGGGCSRRITGGRLRGSFLP